MSTTNPFFKHVDRAAYELPNLLKNLGEVDYRKPISQDQIHIVDAIASHARNAHDTLLDGVASIGRLMNIAGLNDEYQMSNDDVAKLGILFTHMAVEAEFMRFTESDMNHILKEQADLQVQTKPVGRRTTGTSANQQGAAS